WYYIVVVPGSQTSRRWENPDEIDLDELLEVSKVSPSRRRRQYAEIPRPYIAAKLEYLPETFTLGDELNYNGFYNRPVPSNQPYQCSVMAEMKEQHLLNANEKQRVFSSSPYSDLLTVDNGYVARSVESPEMLWVMGPVLAVVLIVSIVIAIILFKR
ncbi:receptor-type tyrosine-protein phosphatase F isoform X2, partial [Tachysurus ichikawai]